MRLVEHLVRAIFVLFLVWGGGRQSFPVVIPVIGVLTWWVASLILDVLRVHRDIYRINHWGDHAA